MPFTPSHAVVALPFLRTPLVPAAIAIGAMTPDLPLFVRFLPLHYGRTHDPAWLGATVLLALALLLVWRAVLRPAVRELSPRWLAGRLPSEWDRGATVSVRETFGLPAGEKDAEAAGVRRGWTAPIALAVSLTIGVISHIVWDLFTHDGRWGVQVLPLLDERWGPLPGFTWLQHGSSLAGLTIIGVWAIVWLSRRPASGPRLPLLPAAVRWLWWASLPVVLALAWTGGLAVLGPFRADFTVAHLAYRVLPPACAVWGVFTVGLCIGVQLLRGRQSSAAERAPLAR